MKSWLQSFQNLSYRRSRPWFWEMNIPIPDPSAPQSFAVPDPVIKETKPSAEEIARQLIIDHPDISASTLLNTLKSKGITLSFMQVQTTMETDSGSSMVAQTRAQESDKHMKMSESVRFLESTTNDGIGPTKFKTILLQEGMGNFGTSFFYTRKALESAVPLFEGKKMYADHPDAMEEQIRPERSVKDVIGHFENVRIEEAEDGRAMLIGDLVMMSEKSFEWARGLVRHAVEFNKKFPDKNFIGLSISAGGSSQAAPIDAFVRENKLPLSISKKLKEALESGISTINVVNKFEDAISCDLVTEPGAGGNVVDILESNKSKEDSMGKEEPKKEAAHADADQDKELIKKYMKDKGMSEADMDEASMNMCHEMYQGYKEMGHESAKALESAHESMNLAKHMGKKKAQEAATKESKSDKDMEEAGKKAKEDDAKKESEATVVEELKKEVVALKATVAKFEEADKKNLIEKHLEKVCKDSGMPNSVTKKFRETIGEPKSVEEVDKMFGIFKEAFTAKPAEGESFITPEKTSSGDGGGRSMSLADCVND